MSAAVFLVVFSARRGALFRIVRLLLLLSPSYRSDRLRLQKPEAIRGVVLHRKKQRLQQFSSSVHNRGSLGEEDKEREGRGGKIGDEMANAERFIVKIEDAVKGRGEEPSLGPVYRSIIAKDGFPPVPDNMQTAWEIFT